MPNSIIKYILLFLVIALLGKSNLSAEEQKVYLFIGDSLTAGYGVLEEDRFTSILSKTCLASKTYKIINAGVSGDTSAGGLRRLKWLMRNKPDVVVIGLGANDGLRGFPASETYKNLVDSIQYVQKSLPSTTIFLAGQKVPPNMGEQYFREFENIYPRVADSTGVTLIPFMLEGVAGVSSLNQSDGIHPNEEGHKRMAELFCSYLVPSLKNK